MAHDVSQSQGRDATQRVIPAGAATRFPEEP